MSIKMEDMQRIIALGQEADLYRKLKQAKEIRNALADDHNYAVTSGADPEVVDAIDLALCEAVEYVAKLAEEYQKIKSENKAKGWS